MRRAVAAVLAVALLVLMPLSASRAARASAKFDHHCFGVANNVPYELDYTLTPSESGPLTGRLVIGQLVGMYQDGFLFHFAGITTRGWSLPAGNEMIANVRTWWPGTSRGPGATFRRWHRVAMNDVVQLTQQGKSVQYVCDV